MKLQNSTRPAHPAPIAAALEPRLGVDFEIFINKKSISLRRGQYVVDVLLPGSSAIAVFVGPTRSVHLILWLLGALLCAALNLSLQLRGLAPTVILILLALNTPTLIWAVLTARSKRRVKNMVCDVLVGLYGGSPVR